MSSEQVVNQNFHTLKLALKKSYMTEIFASLVHNNLGKDFEVKSIKIKTSRIRANSCLIRYTVNCIDRSDQQKFAWPIIGKVFRTTRGESVFANMQWLWDNGFSREANDGISIPQPIYFSHELCLLLQEEVPGEPVKELLKKSAYPEHLLRTAQCLAKLHSCQIELERNLIFSDLMARVTLKVKHLCTYFPDLKSSIDYILEGASHYEDRHQPLNLAPIHGDLHLGQIHLQGEKAWILDFDRMSCGDPAFDLAKILTFLRGITHNVANNSKLISAFFDQYFTEMDLRITKRILLYESLFTLNRAYKYLQFFKLDTINQIRTMIKHRRFVQLTRWLNSRNDWEKKVHHLIQHAAECCELAAKETEVVYFWRDHDNKKVENLYLQ